MEIVVCVGLILILTEFREWRFNRRIERLGRAIRVIHQKQISTHNAVTALDEGLASLATEESVLSVVASVERVGVNMETLVKEKEQVAKYVSRPEFHADIIEGGL